MSGADVHTGGGARSTVLVADDDADILELLCCVLERGGYLPLGAADGEQALDLARGHLPQACILDLVMPGLGGLDLLRTLRREAPTGRIPVLVLSASVQDPDLDAAIKAGASDFMTKPFNSAELLRRLAVLLDGG